MQSTICMQQCIMEIWTIFICTFFWFTWCLWGSHRASISRCSEEGKMFLLKTLESQTVYHNCWGCRAYLSVFISSHALLYPISIESRLDSLIRWLLSKMSECWKVFGSSNPKHTVSSTIISKPLYNFIVITHLLNITTKLHHNEMWIQITVTFAISPPVTIIHMTPIGKMCLPFPGFPKCHLTMWFHDHYPWPYHLWQIQIHRHMTGYYYPYVELSELERHVLSIKWNVRELEIWFSNKENTFLL